MNSSLRELLGVVGKTLFGVALMVLLAAWFGVPSEAWLLVAVVSGLLFGAAFVAEADEQRWRGE